MIPRFSTTLVLILAWVVFAGSGAWALGEEAAALIAAAPDRSDDDRVKDERRQPGRFLAFSGVALGDRVADIGAGSGYTTELLARAVGASGTIYGHNTPRTIEKYVGESWPARLAKPVNRRVVRADRELGDPLPEEATELDLITIIFFYHDAVLYGVDGAALAKRFFEALRPGGAVVLVDHAAKSGAPLRETADSVHRIDEDIVKRDFEGAGFRLAASADYMRNPADPKDARGRRRAAKARRRMAVG
jgi:predicted methyltransferase